MPPSVPNPPTKQVEVQIHHQEREGVRATVHKWIQHIFRESKVENEYLGTSAPMDAPITLKGRVKILVKLKQGGSISESDIVGKLQNPYWVGWVGYNESMNFLRDGGSPDVWYRVRETKRQYDIVFERVVAE